MKGKSKREYWSGRLGFVLAASGSAIGLGNLWKFPYIAWKNGGGLFILVYILCVILVGLPIMISEIVIGKCSQKDPVGAFKKLHNLRSPFRFLGFLGIISAFILLSYYSVIAGWGIEFEIKSIQNKFAKVSFSDMNRMLLAEEPIFMTDPDENEHKTGKQYLHLETEQKRLEKITRIIANSSSKTAISIKTAAIKDSILANPSQLPSQSTKKRLIADAGLISFSDKLNNMEINQIFESNKEVLIEKMKKNNTFKKWADKFFHEKVISSDYQDWLQRSFMPLYSSFMFDEFLNDPRKMILWHGLIMLIIFLIALKGIREGVEFVSKIGMLMLFVIMLFLMVNSVLSDPLNQGIQFLLWGEPHKLNKNSFLEALGHAFFTLSLGIGVMITYGSYLKENSNTIANAGIITLMDTLIALIACLMIFPIIFAHGFTPTGGGIGILFTTLPLEFAKFAGGQYLSILFYFLVLFAAITSAISLLEVVITHFQDEFNMNRFRATFVSSILIFIAGIPSAMNLNFLEGADLLVSHILLPLGGFFIAIFTGYKMDMSIIEKEFKKHGFSMKLFSLFKITIRYITPLLVVLVLIQLIYSDFLE